MHEDTIVAIATGPNDAALGVIRLSGPAAAAVVDACFADASGGPLSARPARVMAYGALLAADGGRLDRVMAVRFAAPHSATGEDMAEVHAHGGALNLAEIMRRLLEAGRGMGLRPALPGEFTRRAFLNGKMDLAEAEAVADLIAARGRLAREVACRQLDGALSREVAAARAHLVDACAALEAGIDFPDEAESLPGLGQAARGVEAAAARLRALLATAYTGRRLRDGLQVALCGRPNTGKSSLLNALCGMERAIVHGEPGTTRDWLEAWIDLDGVAVRLVDTAGIRGQVGAVEARGVALGVEQAQRADVRVLVVDASQGFSVAVAAAFDRLRRQGLVALANKADLVAPGAALPTLPQGVPVFGVSAKTGEGLDAFKAWLRSEALGGLSSQALGQVLVTSLRHEEALKRASGLCDHILQTLQQGGASELILVDVHEALDALGEVVGQTTRMDVLDSIFAKFCLGK